MSISIESIAQQYLSIVLDGIAARTAPGRRATKRK